MIFKLFILVLFIEISGERFDSDSFNDGVISDTDVYSSRGTGEDVLRGSRDVYVYTRSPRKIKKHISIESLEDTAYMDRLDFHYPEVEFLTKNDRVELETDGFDKKFSVLHTLTVTDGQTNSTFPKFPRLKKKRHNSTFLEYKPVRLSYVQKIPKPEHEVSRYEEMADDTTEVIQQDSTREKINNLLKKYLHELYIKRFNSTTTTTTIPPAVEPISDDSTNTVETKLFNKNLWLAYKKKKINKLKKLFNLFTVVQFNNTECNATSEAGSYLGVCYTAKECDDLGGTAVEDCAFGYGVCCVFKGTCGDTAAQNCSYFESPNYPDYYPAGSGVIIPTTLAPPTTTTNRSPTPDPRWAWYFHNDLNRYNVELARQSLDTALSCIFSVYKISDDVQKMKIDFLDFELVGPTNGTCTVERLVITGQSTNSIVPAICGYNTGQSIYVDVSQSTGPLRLMILSTISYKKRFRLRICQYTDFCLSDNCLQIYDGVTGTISSFNYDQAAMLNRSVPGYFNNLNYAICIKKAPGYCSVTYRNVLNGIEYPFNLVNFVNGISTVPLGMAGVDVIDCPNDYIGIDTTRLCGYKFNDGSVTTNLSLNAAITDTNAGPIVIPVRTNAAAVGYGFKLFYTQNRCST